MGGSRKGILLVLSFLFILSAFILQHPPAFAYDRLPIGLSLSKNDITLGASGPEEDFPEDVPLVSADSEENLTIGSSGSLDQIILEISAVRRNTDIFLYFIIPVSFAFFLIYKLCYWFYSTFIQDAL